MRLLRCCGAPLATGLLADGVRPWQPLGTGIVNRKIEHLVCPDMGWEKEINGIEAKSLPRLQFSAN